VLREDIGPLKTRSTLHNGSQFSGALPGSATQAIAQANSAWAAP